MPLSGSRVSLKGASMRDFASSVSLKGACMGMQHPMRGPNRGMHAPKIPMRDPHRGMREPNMGTREPNRGMRGAKRLMRGPGEPGQGPPQGTAWRADPKAAPKPEARDTDMRPRPCDFLKLGALALPVSGHGGGHADTRGLFNAGSEIDDLLLSPALWQAVTAGHHRINTRHARAT